MAHKIDECAPALVAALERAGLPLQHPETHALAGRLLLELAEHNCDDAMLDLNNAAQTLVQECIASGLLDPSAPAVPSLDLPDHPQLEKHLPQLIAILEPLQYQALALISGQKLSVTEAASVLHLSSEMTLEYCNSALQQLRQQLTLINLKEL